jgi:hypothetical protein
MVFLLWCNLFGARASLPAVSSWSAGILSAVSGHAARMDFQIILFEAGYCPPVLKYGDDQLFRF